MINTKVILKAAELGSFQQAAAQMGYTQAGVSYIISSAEKEIGFPLFIREYGGVRLSSEGELLLPFIRQLDTDSRLLDEKINDIKGLNYGRLRILVFDSVAIHWIPKILKKFKEDYPFVQIELISMEDSSRAEEMILRGDADCAFFLHSPVRHDLFSIPLIEEKMQVIVGPSHPMASERIFPVAMLDKFPYIRMAFGPATGVEKIFTGRGITPDTSYELDNDYAAMAMVSAGHGFCIFPEMILQDIPYDLRILDFDERITRTVSIAARSADGLSNAAARFMDYTGAWVIENCKGALPRL